MRRRFSGKHTNWAMPDLISIDGGKGQLAAATEVLDELGVRIPAIGLAKRHEEIVQRVGDMPIGDESGPRARRDERIDGEFRIIALSHTSKTLQLLQRIRDEAHRFAVSYHTTVRDKRTKTSILDTIPGVGPVTRKKLIRHFGSTRALSDADEATLATVVGASKAKVIKRYL